MMEQSQDRKADGVQEDKEAQLVIAALIEKRKRRKEGRRQ